MSRGNELIREIIDTYSPAVSKSNGPQHSWRADSAVVEHARKYVSRIPGAISGSGGHNATFHVACVLVKGFELSPDQAFDVLREWNTGCEPQWADHELKHKIQSAQKAGGETGYLRNSKPDRWDSIAVPKYTAKPEQPATKPKKVHPTADAAADALAWSMVENGILSEQRKPDAGWRYRNADGTDAGAVKRWNLPDGRKEIRQVSAVGGGWITSAMPEPRPLYRLPEIIDADEVWICEGEKAADAAVSLGLQATTSAGGSNAADKSDWSTLNGKRVYILPDNDSAGDGFAGRVVALIRQQAPTATVEIRLLQSDWPEIPDGGDVYDWQEHFDSMDAETLRARLRALPNRIAEYNIPEIKAEAEEQSENDQRATEAVRTFAGKPAAELWDLADQPVQWLVEGVFSCDQPTIFGAKQKSLKTTLLTDLAVSLASGFPWLGRFAIPQKRRVLFVTGEASESAAIRKVKRAATARNLRREDFTDSLRIEALTFPTLPSDKDCAAVADAVRENGIEVVLLDPLYMGLQGLNTANLTEVGPAMRQFMASCRPANVIIAHHVKKTASFDDAPNLEDLSQAGIAEFAGNYWLMGRMSEYTGDGMHSLAIRFGGRDEQFGLLKLDFDERDWKAEFTSLVDHREDLKVRKETERINAMSGRIEKELGRVSEGMSEYKLAVAVGTQKDRGPFQDALNELHERNRIILIPDFKAERSRTTSKGWKLAAG